MIEMQRNKQKLEDLVEAVIARHSGMPYIEVIEGFRLTPLRFLRGVNDLVDGEYVFLELEREECIVEIVEDDSKYAELFDMGEDYLRERYNGILSGRERVLPAGTPLYWRNIYHLTSMVLNDLPGFKDGTRDEKIEIVKKKSLIIKVVLKNSLSIEA